MRSLLAAVVVIALVIGALFLFGVLPPGSKEPPAPDLFALISEQDMPAIEEFLADGLDPLLRSEGGLTPLQAAVEAGAPTTVLEALLEAGAAIDARGLGGATALQLAAQSGEPTVVSFLLNAGADPTLQDSAGRSAIDLAAENPKVRTSGIYSRLREFLEQPFTAGWPSGYVVPVEGATISSRRSHLPGARRAYRNGYHEGFDFYSGTVSVAIDYGTPIHAAADGVVIRADTGYVEHTMEEYQALIDTAMASLDTPPDILDGLRGRQVWVRHAGGFVTRYAHLSAIPDGVVVGATVRQGDVVGATGNSGTEEAAMNTEDGPHPHVEVWRPDGVFLGAGMEPEEIWVLAGQLFGEAALPPFHD